MSCSIPAIFFRNPVDRLSTTRTVWPSETRCLVRLHPINPAPPVTSVRSEDVIRNDGSRKWDALCTLAVTDRMGRWPTARTMCPTMTRPQKCGPVATPIALGKSEYWLKVAPVPRFAAARAELVLLMYECVPAHISTRRATYGGAGNRGQPVPNA